jgi:hypothetical protein
MVYEYHTPAHQQALTRKIPNFSSFKGLGGKQDASRVATDELNSFIHLTL